MREKRKLTRRVADIVLEVSDHNTSISLGRVVNITTEGLLLIGDEPISVDAIFQMDMSLPKVQQGIDKISFGATALWSSPARQKNCYWTGFHIIDISPETVNVIDAMIEDWQIDGEHS